MDNEVIKLVVDNATKCLKKLNEEAEAHKQALIYMRTLCPHDWECTGRDSHKEHYTCSICGDTDQW